MNTAATDIPPESGRPLWAATTIFLVFFAIAIGLGFWQHRQNALIAENAFLYESHQLAERIEARLLDYRQALRGIRGIFTAKPDANRVDFDAYAATRDMAKEFPGAVGMGFVRRVRKASGDAMILEYMHPPALERKAAGFDLGSEPLRRATALKAMRSGDAALSPPLKFSHHLDRQDAAFAYLLPIYRRGLATDTPERREAALLGWSLLIVDTEAMLRPFFDGRLDFALFDVTPETGSGPLFFDADNHMPADTLLEDAETFHFGQSLLARHDVGDGARTWRLLISPLPQFWQALGLLPPWLFVLGGLLVALLSAVSAYLLMATRRNAQLLAARMTEKLRQSEERAREFSQSASDWFWETDAEYRFLYFSDNFGKMLRIDAARMLGKRGDEMLAKIATIDADRLARHLACLAAREPFRDFEYLAHNGDGSECWVSVSGVPHFDAAGRFAGYRGTGTDITARKTAEEGLIHARDAAERASRAKTQFLSSMSHELRTPLNAILGFAQLMRHDKTLDADQCDSIDEILKAGRHLLDLINEVLDLARIESGQLSLSLEPVELGALIQECRQLVQPLAQARELRLHASVAPETSVRVDRVRLKQALINLLSNAIKYNHPGGRVDLSVSETDADRVRILVADSGPGIDAAKLATVFEPFNRAGREGSNIEGTGIGLSITRRLVELMGGKIDASSEVGVGSRFWIDLPITRNEQENS